MRITVHIYSYLRQYLPASEKATLKKELDLPEPATVRQLFERLKMPEGVRVAALVNGNSADKMAVLKEGDVVHVIPQMGGG